MKKSGILGVQAKNVKACNMEAGMSKWKCPKCKVWTKEPMKKVCTECEIEKELDKATRRGELNEYA